MSSSNRFFLKLTIVFGALFAALALESRAYAQIPRTPSPKDAKVYFISPKNGDTVKSPVLVRFGLSQMGIAPAGVNSNNTGHHHLLIDTQVKDFSIPIPNDEKHRHFGGGQTEVAIDLKPGKHKLQLLLGDHLHIPHNPPLLSEWIEINVAP